MAKSKVLVCTNVLRNVDSLPFGTVCQEWFRMGRGTDDEFFLFHPERFSIDNARTQAAAAAMELECDYIMFIDDDMVLSAGTYASLKACDADIAMAHTYIRGFPFDVMFFKYDESEDSPRTLKYFNQWESHVNEKGIVHVDAVGFACALLKVKNLYEIPPPFFVTGKHQTEDVYFCIKLREYFPDAIIVVDTKVPTGHMLQPEYVRMDTRAKLFEYYKPAGYKGKKDKKASDRGEEYVEKNIKNPSLEWKSDLPEGLDPFAAQDLIFPNA